MPFPWGETHARPFRPLPAALAFRENQGPFGAPLEGQVPRDLAGGRRLPGKDDLRPLEERPFQVPGYFPGEKEIGKGGQEVPFPGGGEDLEAFLFQPGHVFPDGGTADRQPLADPLPGNPHPLVFLENGDQIFPDGIQKFLLARNGGYISPGPSYVNLVYFKG